MDGEKRRIRHHTSYLVALLWRAKTGGERESIEKKERERKKISVLCRGLTYHPEQPRHEAQGGQNRRKSATGRLNASAGTARGQRSQRQITRSLISGRS